MVAQQIKAKGKQKVALFDFGFFERIELRSKSKSKTNHLKNP